MAKINLLNNMYLKNTIGDDKIAIFSFISPTVDFDSLRTILASLLSLFSILLVPLSLSLGVPLILYSIVHDKEYKIRHLLEINGLKIVNYWLATFFYNFWILNLVSIVFIGFAYLFVDIDFYQDTSKVVLIYVIGIWNIN